MCCTHYKAAFGLSRHRGFNIDSEHRCLAFMNTPRTQHDISQFPTAIPMNVGTRLLAVIARGGSIATL